MDERQARLENAIDSAMTPVYMRSKSEIVEYLKDTYGEKKWSSHAAALISGTSNPKDKAYKSAIRNFQGGRENSTPRTKKDVAKWEGIGKSLPPTGKKPPKNGFRVTFAGKVKVSEGRKKSGKKGRKSSKMRGDGWANANFTREITGADAVDFANNPTYGQIFSEYFTNFIGNPVTDFNVYGLHVEGLN